MPVIAFSLARTRGVQPDGVVPEVPLEFGHGSRRDTWVRRAWVPSTPAQRREAAAHREIDALQEDVVFLFEAEDHGVAVRVVVLHGVQDDVLGAVGDGLAADVQVKGASLSAFLQLFGGAGVGLVAEHPGHDRAQGAVPPARGRQRAEKPDFQGVALEAVGFREFPDAFHEVEARLHGADGVRAGRAWADLEEFEYGGEYGGAWLSRRIFGVIAIRPQAETLRVRENSGEEKNFSLRSGGIANSYASRAVPVSGWRSLGRRSPGIWAVVTTRRRMLPGEAFWPEQAAPGERPFPRLS